MKPAKSYRESLLHDLKKPKEAATKVNETRLAKLETRAFAYDAVIDGDFDESSFPTASQLKLKVGAQVLMIQNDPGKRWVNGSVGEVTKLGKDS